MHLRLIALLLPLALVAPGCRPAPIAGVERLDAEYGLAPYVLGDSLYSSAFAEAQRTSLDYDVLEFEAFGSRFADRMPLPAMGDSRLFGAPLARVSAGVIDGALYAILLYLDADSLRQTAILDSLVARYGPPTTVNEASAAGEGMRLEVDLRRWDAARTSLAYARGDGYAEVLVFDPALRQRRLDVQRAVAAAREARPEAVESLLEVGTVALQITEPFAQWRYRFEREARPARDGVSGQIDYSLVQPFFEVRGRSLFGLDMARTTLHFLPRVDSLRTMEVRFDNTQGQTVGFTEMLTILERKLGPAPYADLLHTSKGPFRRAIWYGSALTVTLEEYRFRPGAADQADIVARFDLKREEVELDPEWMPWVDPEPLDVPANDSLGVRFEVE